MLIKVIITIGITLAILHYAKAGDDVCAGDGRFSYECSAQDDPTVLLDTPSVTVEDDPVLPPEVLPNNTATYDDGHGARVLPLRTLKPTGEWKTIQGKEILP